MMYIIEKRFFKNKKHHVAYKDLEADAFRNKHERLKYIYDTEQIDELSDEQLIKLAEIYYCAKNEKQFSLIFNLRQELKEKISWSLLNTKDIELMQFCWVDFLPYITHYKNRYIITDMINKLFLYLDSVYEDGKKYFVDNGKKIGLIIHYIIEKNINNLMYHSNETQSGIKQIIMYFCKSILLSNINYISCLENSQKDVIFKFTISNYRCEDIFKYVLFKIQDKNIVREMSKIIMNSNKHKEYIYDTSLNMKGMTNFGDIFHTIISNNTIQCEFINLNSFMKEYIRDIRRFFPDDSVLDFDNVDINSLKKLYYNNPDLKKVLLYKMINYIQSGDDIPVTCDYNIFIFIGNNISKNSNKQLVFISELVGHIDYFTKQYMDDYTEMFLSITCKMIHQCCQQGLVNDMLTNQLLKTSLYQKKLDYRKIITKLETSDIKKIIRRIDYLVTERHVDYYLKISDIKIDSELLKMIKENHLLSDKSLDMIHRLVS